MQTTSTPLLYWVYIGHSESNGTYTAYDVHMTAEGADRTVERLKTEGHRAWRSKKPVPAGD